MKEYSAMFKKCTYFFIPFLLYSSIFGMEEFTRTLERNRQDIDELKISQLKKLTLKFEQAEAEFEKLNQDLGKRLELERLELERYKKEKVQQNKVMSEDLQDEKERSNKLENKNNKTDTSGDKEPKALNNKKENLKKKSTLSQGFPFGKAIAVAGILSIIAFLYHKHSKANKHSTQTA